MSPGAPPESKIGLSGLCSGRYLKHTLDQYVESDYTLLYLHHGLTSDNKPSLSWLRDAYREFDRKWVQGPGGRWLWSPQLCQVLGCPLLARKLGGGGRQGPPHPG